MARPKVLPPRLANTGVEASPKERYRRERRNAAGNRKRFAKSIAISLLFSWKRSRTCPTKEDLNVVASTLRCAIYARKSTDDSDKDDDLQSCSMQASNARKFAESRDGACWRIISTRTLITQDPS